MLSLHLYMLLILMLLVENLIYLMNVKCWDRAHEVQCENKLYGSHKCMRSERDSGTRPVNFIIMITL